MLQRVALHPCFAINVLYKKAKKPNMNQGKKDQIGCIQILMSSQYYTGILAFDVSLCVLVAFDKSLCSPVQKSQTLVD